MSDVISRQAAIDLLKQMRKDGDMIPWEGKDVFARIRKLPPAQPAKVATDINVGDKDTISRKAAIEEIERWLGYIDDDMVRRMQIGMKRLPPAQPEQLEQCPIYGGMCAYPSDQCYDCPRHAGAKMEVTE